MESLKNESQSAGKIYRAEAKLTCPDRRGSRHLNLHRARNDRARSDDSELHAMSSLACSSSLCLFKLLT